MANFGTVSIECSKEGVKFSCAGDIGSGSVVLKQNTDLEKPGENVEIDMSEPVALTFSLKYLMNFCKASGLSESVKLCLSSEVPLLVEYTLQGSSYLRFYLAPKVRIQTISSNSQTNMRRLATRTKRSMMSSTLERYVFRIEVGDLWRNGFAMHRASVSFMVLACDIGEKARLQVVFRALGTKGKLPPHQGIRVISRGISDKEINTVYQQRTPPAYSHLFSHFLTLSHPHRWLLTR